MNLLAHRSILARWLFCLSLALLLPGASRAEIAVNAGVRWTPAEERDLREVARRTWKCLAAALDPDSGLPADHLERTAAGRLEPADYTTAANVGLALMALPAARDLGLITAAGERRLLSRALGTLEKMPDARGLYYNYFKTADGAPDPKRFVSSVDNAWLAAGLWVVSQSEAKPLRVRAQRLYVAMDFSAFYDPGLGQFRHGYSEAAPTTPAAHYGLLCTETRIISVIAIGKGQAPAEQWFRLHRTPPADWTWQRQTPQGRTVTSQGGSAYFAGYYNVDGTRLVPSWGGSLFEFLMPLLVVPELELARTGLGENDRRAVRLQKDYCLKVARYPVWGLSPCSGAGAGQYQYTEAGYPELGVKGYPDLGLVAPYASLLALEIDPEGVLRNVRELQRHYKVWTRYGFLDAVNVKTGEAAQRYLFLDQAMIFLSLHNALHDGKTRKRFFSGDIEKRVAPLLREEKFY
jgi:hypothetical protein